MSLILIRNTYRIWVESFALHVHFTCVGLNCQRNTKTTHSGIYGYVFPLKMSVVDLTQTSVRRASTYVRLVCCCSDGEFTCFHF